MILCNQKHHLSLIQIFAAITTGIAFFLSFPDYNYFWLAWLAFLPLLFALEKTSLQQSYFLGSISGLIMFLGATPWIRYTFHDYMGIIFPFNYLALLIYAFILGQVFAVLALCYRWLEKSENSYSLFLFPALATFICQIFPMFYFPLGIGQSVYLWMIQPLEFVGVWGFNLVTLFITMLLFKLLKKDFHFFNWQSLLIIFLIILWYASGFYRFTVYQKISEHWSQKKIGIVQSNRAASLKLRKPDYGYSYIYPWEMEMTSKLSKEGAEVVIWPEGQSVGYSLWPEVNKAFQNNIKNMQVDLLFEDTDKVVNDKNTHYYRTMFWLDQNGTEAGKSYKNILVPFGEYIPFLNYFRWIPELMGINFINVTAGKEVQRLSPAGINVFPVICYESLFADHLAKKIQNNLAGTVIVVVSHDGWYGGSQQQIQQHIALTNLRAIEHRVPLIHVIVNGPSYIIAPTGEYWFQTPAKTRGGWITNLKYSAQAGGSFYTQYPNLIKWIILLYLMITILKTVLLNSLRIPK